MRRIYFCLLLTVATSTLAADNLQLVRAAMSSDAAAITRLRSMGREGVALMRSTHDRLVNDTTDEQRYRQTLDRVCAQRDCAWSGLFWHSDPASARTTALATGKPILMLRLLGRLDDDLSCANSRFFRTMLYSDPRISELLDQNFVLLWTSERPVPSITIDFGDGRTLRRTLTGNSAHYLLDAEGNVLDVLPGLYEPRTFLRALLDMKELHRTYRGSETKETRQALIREHHAVRARFEFMPASKATAWIAAKRAMTKARVETPILERIWFAGREIIVVPDEPDVPPAILHPHSVALLREKRGDVEGFEGALDSFRRSVARDTILNETRLRPMIRRWLAAEPWTFERLNERVYTEVFLTPASDPWLGLASADVVSAIDGEGFTR